MLRVALSAGLIAFLIWRYGRGSLIHALIQERPAYFLAAVALYVAGQVMSAYRWQLLAGIGGLAGPFPEFFAFYFIGMFTNLFVPGLVGGDAARAFYLSRRHSQFGKAAASVVADRAVGLVALTWLAAICGWLLGRDMLAPALLVPMVAVGSAAMLGYLALPSLVPLLRWAPGRLSRLVGVLIPYFASRAALIAALALSLVLQISLAVCQYLLALGLGLEIPFWIFLLCVPAANFFASIPVTLNGLGLRESAYIYLFGLASVGKVDAIALGLLWFAATMAGGATGALAFLMTDRLGARAITASEDSASATHRAQVV